MVGAGLFCGASGRAHGGGGESPLRMLAAMQSEAWCMRSKEVGKSVTASKFRERGVRSSQKREMGFWLRRLFGTDGFFKFGKEGNRMNR
jgi:hypothetical protein